MQAIAQVQGQGSDARTAGRVALRAALLDTRSRTLALFAAFEEGLAGKCVPVSGELNPPLWELGHVGWFQDWWIARNRERRTGIACTPDHPRAASRLAAADSLYDSSRVAHGTRWTLSLPDASATHGYLSEGLEETLALLEAAGEGDADLYFFRLVLLHEDMHAEAATYMAQSLGIALPHDIAFPSLSQGEAAGDRVVKVPACTWRLGLGRATGFAFDNELAARDETLVEFEIDAAPVTWARFLPFAQAGGYRDERWWTPAGWSWRVQSGLNAPRYVRESGGAWERMSFGTWAALDPRAVAVHLTLHEAQAWCRWAGRRLPSEAEWECAAHRAEEFSWGRVWEWTASAFQPFPGFEAHPYRDYSAPWFGTRQVLRGACAATHPRMAHRKYRNFFSPERNDIYGGFRSVAHP